MTDVSKYYYLVVRGYDNCLGPFKMEDLEKEVIAAVSKYKVSVPSQLIVCEAIGSINIEFTRWGTS